MRKIILSQHSTLDGFASGTNSDMDWINFDDELFELVHTFTGKADTALYGRITYEMMDDYWPSAAEKPNATKPNIGHSDWYNRVDKMVLPRTLKGKGDNKTRFKRDNIWQEINELKN